MVTGLVIPLHNIKELLSRNCTYISVKCIQTQLLFCKQIYPCGYRILKYGGILVEMWLSYSPIVNHVLWSNLASLITQGKYYQSILYVHKQSLHLDNVFGIHKTKQNKVMGKYNATWSLIGQALYVWWHIQINTSMYINSNVLEEIREGCHSSILLHVEPVCL